MKSLFTCIIVVACIFQLSCSDKQEIQEKTTQQQEPVPEHSAPVVKNSEIELIEKESGNISVNPGSVGEFCDSKQAILRLSKFATNTESKEYVKKKQGEMLEILRRFRMDIVKKEVEWQLSDDVIKTFVDGVLQKNIHDNQSIVSSVRNDYKTTYGEGTCTKTSVYFVVFKLNKGMFSSDVFDNYKLTVTSLYVMKCDDTQDPVKHTYKWEKLSKG